MNDFLLIYLSIVSGLTILYLVGWMMKKKDDSGTKSKD